MTAFIAFVTFQSCRGAEAHISVAREVTTVDGRPIYAIHGEHRSIHAFEAAFDSLEKARRWCAQQMIAYSEQTAERAAELIREAEEGDEHGIV